MAKKDEGMDLKKIIADAERYTEAVSESTDLEAMSRPRRASFTTLPRSFMRWHSARSRTRYVLSSVWAAISDSSARMMTSMKTSARARSLTAGKDRLYMAGCGHARDLPPCAVRSTRAPASSSGFNLAVFTGLSILYM